MSPDIGRLGEMRRELCFVAYTDEEVARMALSELTDRTQFSEEFYASLLEMPDGERFKTCLQCGTCSGVCPFGFSMEMPPGAMIGALRAGQFQWALESDTVWLCVSCFACTEGCPVEIPLTSALMTRAKEELLLAGNVPTGLQRALESSRRFGNPLGEPPEKRADWLNGLSFEVPILGKANRPVEVLWFVGDYGSYHPRVREATRALALILSRLGVDFGILGTEEQTDGDSQRLAGERGLFKAAAEKNGQAFSRYEFGEIVTADPHSYNALKNEYPALGIGYPVRHYTEFLVDHLEDLQPLLTRELNLKVTYHDACYLGRANGIYEEPRKLLGAIPGVELVEMSHRRSNSLCCGGGGGGMWLEDFQCDKAGARLSDWRVKEAVAAGADVLAVACPYEKPRFEDAVKSVPEAEGLVVKDIAELLAEAMGGGQDPSV